MLGIVTLRNALTLAEDRGLDLVEISPHAEPPVCKIMDYGKFKYEEKKKSLEAKKKQRVVELKEVKFRPNIGQHDYDVKLKSINRFIEEGDKVKITLKFKGRELAHQEIGMEVINRIKEDCKETIKVEFEPRMEGKQILMIISPK